MRKNLLKRVWMQNSEFVNSFVDFFLFNSFLDYQSLDDAANDISEWIVWNWEYANLSLLIISEFLVIA